MSKTNRRDFLLKGAALIASPLLINAFAGDAVAEPSSGIFKADSVQNNWRYCDKCFNLFYDGAAEKGRCSAGAGHRAQGYNFLLLYGNLPEVRNGQINWRYCEKCRVMFFDGSNVKGRCAAGVVHNAAGYNFRLGHEITISANDQADWRFCEKCFAMFFNGYPGKGSCPAGGGHVAQGYSFVLSHAPAAAFTTGAEEVNFRQEIVTPSGTALRGFVDLTLRSDGTYKSHFHMRSTGAIDYNFTVRAAFAASNGMTFALQHSGRTEGTNINLFDKPDRNDDYDIQGTNSFIEPVCS